MVRDRSHPGGCGKGSGEQGEVAVRGNGGKLVGVSSPANDVEEPESADATGSTDELLAAIVAGEPETGRFGARLPRRDRGRGWLMRRALAAADVLGLTLAFGFSLV